MESEKKELIILFLFIGVITIASIAGTVLAALRYRYVFDKNGGEGARVKLVDEDGLQVVIDNYFKNTKKSKDTVQEIANNIGRYQFNNGIRQREDARFKLLVTKHPYSLGLCDETREECTGDNLKILTSGNMGIVNKKSKESTNSYCDSIDFSNADDKDPNSFFINSSERDEDIIYFKLHQR